MLRNTGHRTQCRGQILRQPIQNAHKVNDKRLDVRLAQEGRTGPGTAATQGIEERLDEALVMLRISHLERLYGELGQSEAMDIIVKLLVPATTMTWYGYKYYKGMP